MILKRYRESFHLARAKDDRKDARMLADLVAERHEQLPVWKPDSAHARELRSLVEHRRSLIDDRTRLVNRLTALLKDYFPQALDLTGKELHARLAYDFLLKWPTLQSLQRARKESIAQFYRSHRSGRPKLLAERLEAIANAIALRDDEALLAASTLKARSFAEQLNLLRNQIERVETRIAELMETHEDAKVFFSLPGAGPVLASRLASTMGTDRARFENAAALQCFTGIAPVTKASGQKHHVHRRFAKCTCPHFEHQSFMDWVGQTIPVSLWASAYYQQQKEHGARHQTALRALAYKWQRIVFRCWKNRELYDESTYLRALERAKSPLVNKIRELKLQRGLEAAA